MEYRDVLDSVDGVARWTDMIRKHGFSYVKSCPRTPIATQTLLRKIAFVRQTHYGGLWDFTSNLFKKDTAYTSLALAAHTDTTYFTDPCGLQMFHLLSHTDGEGGESLLVDGFKAAAILQNEDPQAYETLSTVNVPTHASGNEAISIQPSRGFPVLNHKNPRQPPKFVDLIQVRWNNDDRGILDEHMSPWVADRWYHAARKWNEIIRRPENEYWAQLKPAMPISTIRSTSESMSSY